VIYKSVKVFIDEIRPPFEAGVTRR